jgi:hypothetical protein
VAAVTQVRHRHSDGHACYDMKLAEGKTRKEALRSLKRQVSNAIFACLQADAARAAARGGSPGGQQGNHSAASAAGSHPRHRLFGPATPGPRHHPATTASKPAARACQEGETLPAPRPARQYPGQGRAFPDRCHPAAGEAAGPGGTPAAKPGRTTWRCSETTAILGREEGHGPRFARKNTAPEGHLTYRESDRRNTLTQRLHSTDVAPADR